MANRFIHEATIHVANSSWEMAAVRLGDVADQAAQLAAIDDGWKSLAQTLRAWAASCSRMAGKDRKAFASRKWGEFVVVIQEKIDAFHSPLAATSEVSNGPD